MINLEEKIRGQLHESKEGGAKKQISLLIKEDIITSMDLISHYCKEITGGGYPLSRNQMMEQALEDYIDAYANVLMEDYKINIRELIETNEEDTSKNQNGTGVSDLIVCPALHQNFQTIFLGQKQWYSVRINPDKIKDIQWIALYVGSPVSGITHYGKVKDINKWHDGKYAILLDGNPIKLPHKIILGNSDVMSVRKLRYSTYTKLMAAKQVSDLW
jgi:hypothetical protein